MNVGDNQVIVLVILGGSGDICLIPSGNGNHSSVKLGKMHRAHGTVSTRPVVVGKLCLKHLESPCCSVCTHQA